MCERNARRTLFLALAGIAACFVAGCGSSKEEAKPSTKMQTSKEGKEAKVVSEMDKNKSKAGGTVETPGQKVKTKKEEKAAAQPAGKAKPAEKKSKPSGKKEQSKAAAPKKVAGTAHLVPLKLKLPKPVFVGTPKNIPPGTTVEKPTGKPRPPLMVPPGVKNVALGKPVTSSDEEPIIGDLDLITDGDKEATEGSYVELGPGLQYVQIDLGAEYKIYAIVIWHYHGDPRVYHDVIVQVADDPDFITNVKTLFNNDHDNSAGLGIGKDREYFETYEGKLIDAKGVKARYVRLYSNGSTADDQNHYTEVEVFGLPAK